MTKAVGVQIEGEVEWHAPNVNGTTDHYTLCGIDPDDPAIGHEGSVLAKRGQKITCRVCKSIVLGVLSMRYRKTDFE